MILDNTLVLSDNQAITATVRSTNTVDLGAAGFAYGNAVAARRDIGVGSTVPFTLNVTQAFNNLTSLTVSMQSDDNTSFSSPKEIGSRTYTLAELNALKILSFPASFPEGTDEQYISLLYTVNGAAPTTGRLTGGVVAAKQQQ